jgi:hypothetical protein
MGGIVVCERYWARQDYDKDLLARARSSIEVLSRAPDDEEIDPLLEGVMIVMDRLDCWDLLKRAKLALEFFYPHFRIHDEIMSRVREDRDWRFKEFFSRLVKWDWKDRNGRALVEQHEKMIAGFERMLGQVSATSKNRIEIETKVVRAARCWIAWHDSELGRCNFRGVYR